MAPSLVLLLAPFSLVLFGRRATLLAPAAASLAPPRIERVVPYDELVTLARTGGVASVQIAPQHDTVVATTRDGRRVACALSDRAFPQLLADTMDAEGLPFEVLPLDGTRAVAKGFASAAAALAAVDLFGSGALGLRERFARLRRPPADDE